MKKKHRNENNDQRPPKPPRTRATVFYARLVVDIREEEPDPYRVRIIIGGDSPWNAPNPNQN